MASIAEGDFFYRFHHYFFEGNQVVLVQIEQPYLVLEIFEVVVSVVKRILDCPPLSLSKSAVSQPAALAVPHMKELWLHQPQTILIRSPARAATKQRASRTARISISFLSKRRARVQHT